MVCTASPKLTGSHGLAPVHARRVVPGLACRCSKQLTASELEWPQAVEGGLTGTMALANGECQRGKREAGALSIAGVTLTLLAARGTLANLSSELIMAEMVWVLSSPGPIARRPVVQRGLTSLDPFLGISSRPHGNATYLWLPNWHSTAALLLPQQ